MPWNAPEKPIKNELSNKNWLGKYFLSSCIFLLVKNIQSKQVGEAKVIGKNEVVVLTFREQILREGK